MFSAEGIICPGQAVRERHGSSLLSRRPHESCLRRLVKGNAGVR
jgi:hypothetical protein